MKIDFSQPLLDMENSPIAVPGPDGELVTKTLGRWCAEACFASLPGDEKLSGVEKVEIGQIGLKIWEGGEIEISSDEAVKIRKRVGAGYPVLIVTRIYEIIS